MDGTVGLSAFSLKSSPLLKNPVWYRSSVFSLDVWPGLPGLITGSQACWVQPSPPRRHVLLPGLRNGQRGRDKTHAVLLPWCRAPHRERPSKLRASYPKQQASGVGGRGWGSLHAQSHIQGPCSPWGPGLSDLNRFFLV